MFRTGEFCANRDLRLPVLPAAEENVSLMLALCYHFAFLPTAGLQTPLEMSKCSPASDDYMGFI